MAEPGSGRGERRPAPLPAGGAAYHAVTDPEQARLLTDSHVLRYFQPFLARERTVTEAARELDADPGVVLYRVRQLLRAGLLTVAREVKRPGRPVKVYRSSHDAYFVPYELTPYASLEERLRAQLAPHVEERVRVMARRLRKRGWSGQLVYRDQRGEAWTVSAADPSAPPDWTDTSHGFDIDYVTEVELTDEEAAAMQRLLYEAFARHQRDAGGRTGAERRYRLTVAFYPLDRP